MAHPPIAAAGLRRRITIAQSRHGFTPTPQQTAEFVRHEAALWKKVVADIGITPE